MSDTNGNGTGMVEADPAEANRKNKGLTLLTHLKILKDMISGSMNGEPGQSRLEVDPDGLVNELSEFMTWSKQEIKEGSLPLDWKAALRAEPIRATALIDLVDAQIPYILKPLIVEGSLTQLQGIPKGGKSAFSVYLALCLATGIWPQPQYLAAAEPVEVLYLAWEDPEIMMAKRLSLYAVGLGQARTFMPEKLTFLFGPDLFVEREDHEQALRAAIEELKPKVIFVDTLSHIHGAEENSSTEMKIPMKALARVAKEMKVGIVYLHHTGKGSGEKMAQDKSRGSGAIAAAWHVLIDWGTREKGSNVNPVEVQSKYEHQWKNWAIAYEPDDPNAPTSVRWNFDAADPHAPKETRKKDAQQGRLVDVFKRLHGQGVEWLKTSVVYSESSLGVDLRTIQRKLKEMCEQGVIESRPDESNPKSILYKLAPSKGNLADLGI